MAGREPCLTCYTSTKGKRPRIRERAAGTAWAGPDLFGPRPLLPPAPRALQPITPVPRAFPTGFQL